MRAALIRRAMSVRIAGAALVGAVAAAPAAAQDAPGVRPGQRWEFEVHAGGTSATNPTAGTSRLPPAGASYVPGGPGPEIPPSRAVPSWYFGDGTVLFNQTRLPFRDVPPLIPLDEALTQAGTRRQRGFSIGFRVERQIGDRFGAEFSLDVNPGYVRMTDEMRTAIEASVASFHESFSRQLDLVAESLTVESQATLRQERGTRLNASGAVNIRLSTVRSVTPYVTIGAGITAIRGSLPSAQLIGHYRFQPQETDAVVDETDTVVIRYLERASPILIIGSGFKRPLIGRSGIRADVRVHIGSNNGRIAVDATPSQAGIPSYSVSFSRSSASMVFATPEARRRSLSGPPITDFETFTGSGSQVLASATFGYFLRF